MREPRGGAARGQAAGTRTVSAGGGKDAGAARRTGAPDQGSPRKHHRSWQTQGDQNMSKLFEYAILYHPKVIKPPEFVLAKDDKEVAIRASRAIPDEYLAKLDQVEIVVRPF